MPAVAYGVLTFTIGGTWDTQDRANAAAAAMQLVVNRFNAYGDFGTANIYVYYDSSIPTAQASYLGSIGFGGTWPAERVAEHESCHYLGTGTNSGWSGLMVGGQWQGLAADTLVQQFDGVGAVLNGDTQHFWPYGLNYDDEGSEINKARCVAMAYALRQDLGIGSTAPPSSATTVTLTTDDALGTSGFNYSTGWSDAHFAHTGAKYYTGNYAIRTPASSSSFNFVGDSLTVNDQGDPNKGLFFKGSGSTGVISFRNLILDGGSIHHYSGASDLFQLAGKVTVASASTINSEQGNTNILANVTGNGTLTIGTTNSFFVRMLSPGNRFTGNINVVGRFELANGANQKFAIGAAGVNNAITGAIATQVLLNGVFDPDLSNASSQLSDSWTLVTAANAVYGSTFGVNGFTENSPGVWSNGNGYSFSESNSRLTVVPKPNMVAWSGNASGNWDGNGNWDAAPPVSGDKLVFAASGPSGATLTDNLMTPGTYNVSGITFPLGAPAYTINPGTAGTNGFTLTGSIANNGIQQQIINDAINLPNGAPKTRSVSTIGSGGFIILGGNISGVGGIAKEGAGTLTLSGSNTYTGGTRVDYGYISLTGTLNPSGALTMGGGIFSYANPAATTQTVAGSIVDAGASVVNNTVSGSTLALGAITRNVGATVDFATTTGAITTTAANTNGILGPWAFFGWNMSTVYACSNGGTIAAYTGATVESGSGALGGIPSGNTSTANYSITSSGTFASMGLWRSVNTIEYKGSGSATQPAANNTWLMINGLMNASNNGTLTIGGSSPRIDVVIGSNQELVVANITGNIVINNNVLDNPSGPSALTKVGTGSLLLAGANTYTGKTTIVAGMLQIGNGTTGESLASSAVYNGGILVFNHADSLTYAGEITGPGNLNKTGGGNLILTGANTFTGLLSVGAGTITIGNGTTGESLASPYINDSGALVFNHADSLTYAGYILGNGSVTKTGAGTLTLKGSNSYTGSTNINQGQLILDGGDLADVSTVNVAGGASLSVLSGTPILGNVAGPGTTSISGSGTVLTVSSLNQSTLTLGPGATLVIAAIPGGPLATGDIQRVPEPQTFVMLLIALAAAAIVRTRSR